MKFSMYNHCLDVDNDTYLVNTRTGKVVRLYKQEEKEHLQQILNSENIDLNDEMVKILCKQEFIVEDNRDEYQEVKSKLDMIHDAEDKHSNYIIFTTDQCNFRCKYCPQEHVSKRFSDELWDAVYKNIRKGVEAKKYESVKISFFGGEPLLESKRIIAFLEKLNKMLDEDFPQVKYFYSMVTNGYLLTPDIYERLIELGLCDFQITVDGFAENHNMNRPLADGSPTWDKIIENLKYIASSKNHQDKVSIILRVNISSKMDPEKAKKFVEWAKKTFDDSKFTFDISAVAEFSEVVDKSFVFDTTDENNNDLLAQLNKIGGQKSYANLSHAMVYNGGACNTSAKYRYTIGTDGKFSKCQQYTVRGENAVCGYLDLNGDFVYTANEKFWTEDFETEECKTCYIYPHCAGRVCPHLCAISHDKRPDCKTMKDTYELSLIGSIKAR